MSLLNAKVSLLGNGTLANISTPYYSGGGGGGGGPVVSTIVVNASTLSVSSITASGPGQSLNFPNGFEMPLGASVAFTAGSGAGGVPDIEWTGNNGQISGVSTINGVAYPPAGAAAISTNATNVWVATSTAVTFTPIGASVTNGKFYNVSLNVLDIGAPVGTIAAKDYIKIYAADTDLVTLNLAQLSTTKGAGDAGFTVSGVVEATSNSLQFFGQTNAGCLASTFVTTGPLAWAIPLN